MLSWADINPGFATLRNRDMRSFARGALRYGFSDVLKLIPMVAAAHMGFDAATTFGVAVGMARPLALGWSIGDVALTARNSKVVALRG
jgi:hypothetical protein